MMRYAGRDTGLIGLGQATDTASAAKQIDTRPMHEHENNDWARRSEEICERGHDPDEQ